MSNIRVYRQGKLTDIQIVRRSGDYSYLGPDMAPGWNDVVIVDSDEHFRPNVRYDSPNTEQFYYSCVPLLTKDPIILMQEALLG